MGDARRRGRARRHRVHVERLRAVAIARPRGAALRGGRPDGFIRPLDASTPGTRDGRAGSLSDGRHVPFSVNRSSGSALCAAGRRLVDLPRVPAPRPTQFRVNRLQDALHVARSPRRTASSRSVGGTSPATAPATRSGQPVEARTRSLSTPG